jgi:hypothetical protein
MSYDPADYQVSDQRLAGPLAVWACVLLGLTLMGHGSSPAASAPMDFAEHCGPSRSGAPLPLQGFAQVAMHGVHAS